MGKEKKLNKVKIKIIPTDYQQDIVKIFFKKDIDFYLKMDVQHFMEGSSPAIRYFR
jgi:hypothetical protein